MSANPLWDFALAAYARPGVAAACLALQDRRGVDVPVLLFAGWAGAVGGVRLTAAEVARIDAVVRPWREEVVHPLRAVRRRIKGDPGAGALYERLKAVELEAERIALDRLYARCAIGPAGMADAACTAANLRLVAPSAAGRDEEALAVVQAGCLAAAQ